MTGERDNHNYCSVHSMHNIHSSGVMHFESPENFNLVYSYFERILEADRSHRAREEVAKLYARNRSRSLRSWNVFDRFKVFLALSFFLSFFVSSKQTWYIKSFGFILLCPGFQQSCLSLGFRCRRVDVRTIAGQIGKLNSNSNIKECVLKNLAVK